MIDITPRDWVDGNLDLTASALNTDVRDAYLLMLNAPTCIVGNNSPQSIPTGASYTPITWANPAIVDTEALDMFASGSPTRVTARTAGWYECTANIVQSVMTANNTMSGAFRINGSSSLIYGRASMLADGATDRSISPCTLIPMNVNDYVELICVHDLGSSVALTVNTYNSPYMVVRRVRGL